MPEIPEFQSQAEIEALILKTNRYLQKLKEQQASLGTHTPPHVLIEIEDLETELSRLQSILAAIKREEYPWQALVVDTDSHWRQIIRKQLNRLGGGVIEHDTIAAEICQKPPEPCALAVIATVSTAELAETDWLEKAVNLGQNLPVVLLTRWDHRDTAIAVRQAFRRQAETLKITTIFKDTFDVEWFDKIVRHTLTQRQLN